MFGIERRKVLPWSEVNPLQIAYSTNHEPPIHKEGLEIVRYPRFVIVWSSSKRGSDFTVNLESGEMKSLAGAAAEFREEEVVIGYGEPQGEMSTGVIINYNRVTPWKVPYVSLPGNFRNALLKPERYRSGLPR